MISLLKSIAKGILYFFAFPFGLLAIALYAIFGLFVFIFQFFRFIFLFFTGRSFKNGAPEDIEAQKILERNKPKEPGVDPSLSLYPSDSIVYGSGYVSPTIETKEEKKEEEETLTPIEEEGGNDNV